MCTETNECTILQKPGLSVEGWELYIATSAKNPEVARNINGIVKKLKTNGAIENIFKSYRLSYHPRKVIKPFNYLKIIKVTNMKITASGFKTIIFGCCLSFACMATELPEGDKVISFIDNDNNAIEIGRITFTHNNVKTTYEITLNENVFQKEFLNMRPFQCLHQPKQILCHLEYPYKKLGYITRDDLMDLEYDLLFLHKTPAEYGIDAWNGLFYLLTATENGIEGTLNEVDLRVLIAPPEDGTLRPVTRNMLYEADPSKHIFPKILIQ